ncbi:MAG: TonB family protein [Pedobacter sp.]|nr:TonB family protein [Pedobacter sp.]MDQ8053130.1 TonB family protein [Pedobacter sp.]
MSLAHYLLQVNIYLIVFYGFYRLLLASETYFVLNRIYLLASGVLSLTIPFLRFEWFGKQEMAKPIYIGVDQLNQLLTQVTVIEEHRAKFDWGNLIVLVYLIGICCFALRLLAQLLAIRKLLKTITNGMAFSFFRKKVISANVPEHETVNLHEEVHVKQLHTIDVLFFEILGIFTWLNPIIYFYKKTIKNIHEYLADEAAAKFQGDKEAYALLLLSQAFGVRPNSLTNGFFTKSLIKKRIFMLHKQRSKKAAILKYGLFVPLFALTLVLSSATIRKNNQILSIAEKLPLENVDQVVKQAISTPMGVINMVAPPPSTTEQLTLSTTALAAPTDYPEHDENASAESLNGFYKYLGDRIKYPSAAVAKKLQGNTIINFSVRHGKISNVMVQTELGEGCDEEVVNEIMAYNDYFQKDGSYSLKVTFKLTGADTDLKNETATTDNKDQALQMVVIGYLPTDDEANKVYSFVALEQPPTYPGGIAKFYEFLGKNMKYPTAAIDNEIQGNVHLSFTVEKDGSLTDLKVERKLGFGTDEEALRVVKLAKRWNPGLQNGKPVRVKYNIPVKFSLEGSNAERKATIMTGIRSKNYNAANAPLLIVDNQIKDQHYMETMDSRNVESIDVIKDGDAINKYGKMAEHGAIIIKTKSKQPTMVTGTLTNKN